MPEADHTSKFSPGADGLFKKGFSDNSWGQSPQSQTNCTYLTHREYVPGWGGKKGVFPSKANIWACQWAYRYEPCWKQMCHGT